MPGKKFDQIILFFLNPLREDQLMAGALTDDLVAFFDTPRIKIPKASKAKVGKKEFPNITGQCLDNSSFQEVLNELALKDTDRVAVVVDGTTPFAKQVINHMRRFFPHIVLYRRTAPGTFKLVTND